tara:strand:+ start:10725 stop:11168 length:444 start_codon:yes stop_codon:yes gene_type:complete
MHQKFAFKTALGSCSIRVSKDIVVSTFSGACCDLIAQRYVRSLTQIVKEFNGLPWAYLGNAQLHLAATPQAERYLQEAYIMAVENNCVADAYCLTSVVGISQLENLRKQVGISTPIKERLFDSISLAKRQLEQELAVHLPATMLKTG